MRWACVKLKLTESWRSRMRFQSCSTKALPLWFELHWCQSRVHGGRIPQKQECSGQIHTPSQLLLSIHRHTKERRPSNIYCTYEVPSLFYKILKFNSQIVKLHSRFPLKSVWFSVQRRKVEHVETSDKDERDPPPRTCEMTSFLVTGILFRCSSKK
jgi:hypothetical protein